MAATIYQQTGWRGRGPKELCQDMSVLVRVIEHDYHLENDGFYKYALERGLGDWRGEDLNSEAVQRTWAAESTEAPAWAASQRGKLQAAWELFCNTSPPLFLNRNRQTVSPAG